MMLRDSIHVVACVRWKCFLDAMVASLFDREKGELEMARVMNSSARKPRDLLWMHYVMKSPLHWFWNDISF